MFKAFRRLGSQLMALVELKTWEVMKSSPWMQVLQSWREGVLCQGANFEL